ncbi:hypothetical protein [Variovorax boronicumulans]|uniref:hypothetical protein n=1 Tax=Variovorax boronicumulans TaxID=436515 RepID=UPI0012E56F8C|nr:hypothetical protein [Variovorax boronicumulans]GER21275.1 hypothetical protein VCH24_63220 [Variovorax boronicumulans]
MTFARKPYERKPQPLYAPVERRGTYARAVTEIPVSVPKTEIVRSEAYRRLVAAMPCIACGCGPCQAAHPNTDKGMAMKTDDRLCFPLCGPQPGRPGCHALFDQGAMFSKAARRAIEPAWGADTRRRILANGQWPQRLPLLNTTPEGQKETP